MASIIFITSSRARKRSKLASAQKLPTTSERLATTKSYASIPIFLLPPPPPRNRPTSRAPRPKARKLMKIAPLPARSGLVASLTPSLAQAWPAIWPALASSPAKPAVRECEPLSMMMTESSTTPEQVPREIRKGRKARAKRAWNEKAQSSQGKLLQQQKRVKKGSQAQLGLPAGNRLASEPFLVLPSSLYCCGLGDGEIPLI